jgi:hypothetical protein
MRKEEKDDRYTEKIALRHLDEFIFAFEQFTVNLIAAKLVVVGFDVIPQILHCMRGHITAGSCTALFHHDTSKSKYRRKSPSF